MKELFFQNSTIKFLIVINVDKVELIKKRLMKLLKKVHD